MASPIAQQFLSCFLEAYHHSRHQCRPEWEQVWMEQWGWDSFMLWKTHLPKGLENDGCVLHQTAAKMGLTYWEREPLKIDRAFYQEGPVAYGFPFPLLVLIEHESKHGGFLHEIMKLLSVRCPLKVGITYSRLDGQNNTAENRLGVREKIHANITEAFSKVRAVIGEDSVTEYLFLIGAEEEQKEMTWYALSFSAAGGPGPGGFFRAEPTLPSHSTLPSSA
jgi:hypothetical protein